MAIRSPFPDFLIIGAMKAGTTSLYDLLQTSSEFCLPLEKEPRILRSGRNREQIEQEYMRHFAGGSGLRGEGSTYYTMMPVYEDVSWLARDIIGGNLRLIMMLRHPLERLKSHLRHDYLVGRLANDQFDEAVWGDPRYIAFSDYARQLEPWVRHFGRDHVLAVNFKDLTENPCRVISKVSQFLQVDANHISINHRHSNAAKSLRITPKGGVLADVVRSRFYRQKVRPRLPRVLHNYLRNGLLDRRELPEVKLSDQTHDMLRPILEIQERNFNALIKGSL